MAHHSSNNDSVGCRVLWSYFLVGYLDCNTELFIELFACDSNKIIKYASDFIGVDSDCRTFNI